MALYTDVELDGVPVVSWLTIDPSETRFHACGERRFQTARDRVRGARGGEEGERESG